MRNGRHRDRRRRGRTFGHRDRLKFTRVSVTLLIQGTLHQVFRANNFGMRLLTRRENLGSDMHSRLLVISDCDLNLARFGQVLRKGLDQAGSQLNIGLIGCRATLNNSQMHATLAMRHRSINL